MTTDGWLLVFHNTLMKSHAVDGFFRLLKSFWGHNKGFLDFILFLKSFLGRSNLIHVTFTNFKMLFRSSCLDQI